MIVLEFEPYEKPRGIVHFRISADEKPLLRIDPNEECGIQLCGILPDFMEAIIRF
jgi:hypothetical protein